MIDEETLRLKMAKYGVCSDRLMTVLRAELKAIEEAIRVAVAPLVIYTDSAYARGCILKGWKSASYAPLVEAIKRLLLDNPISWSIIWVPGHADVEGNEQADAIANRAARGSMQGRGIDVAHCLLHLNFLNL